MNTSATSSAPWILNGLLETCRDGQEGFHHAAEHVRNADCQALFHELAVQRQLYAGELQTLLQSLHEGAAQSGTIAGALHRGWMDLKSLVTSGSESSLLQECERGDDAAVAQYREVLDHDEMPQNARHIVQRQLDGLESARDRIHSLRMRCEESRPEA
jgi:uncharacterized protein (TIGR02284 family)